MTLAMASVASAAEPQIVGEECVDASTCPYLFACEPVGAATKCAYHAADCATEADCVEGFRCVGKTHCGEDACTVDDGLCIPKETPCIDDAGCMPSWTCVGLPIEGPGEGEAFSCLPPGWGTLKALAGKGGSVPPPAAVPARPAGPPPEPAGGDASVSIAPASSSSAGCAAGTGAGGGLGAIVALGLLGLLWRRRGRAILCALALVACSGSRTVSDPPGGDIATVDVVQSSDAGPGADGAPIGEDGAPIGADGVPVGEDGAPLPEDGGREKPPSDALGEDAGPVEPKPCTSNSDCPGGWCVGGRDEGFCTKTCTDECPTGFVCLPTEAADASECVPLQTELCRPCLADSDCGALPADVAGHCLDYGAAGHYCGSACAADAECPDGFGCDSGQCRKGDGACTCSESAIAEGASTTCASVNEAGKCEGTATCQPDGTVACAAATPSPEACNGLDDDCDEATDEGFPDSDADGAADCVDPDTDGDGVDDTGDTCPDLPDPDQTDTDGDGAGNPCDPDDDGDGTGDESDCDPVDAALHPGASEACDGIDADCDGETDEGRGTSECGKGACVHSEPACSGGKAGECNPLQGAAPEACNGVDDDCDGEVDEAGAAGCVAAFADADGDGFGAGAAGACECDPSGGTAPTADDCDDSKATVHPGAVDVCDNFIDDDCDGYPDEGCYLSNCKAIYAEKSQKDGVYSIDPDGFGGVFPLQVFCDMKSSGGGWTLITDVKAEIVDLIAGTKARQMLKCLDFGTTYVISPPFSEKWSWTRSAPAMLAGTWDVNGTPTSCGTSADYTQLGCSTWWGFGCGSGVAGGNQLAPGVITVPLKCADDTSAHTGGAFSICSGKENYGYWSAFVREED